MEETVTTPNKPDAVIPALASRLLIVHHSGAASLIRYVRPAFCLTHGETQLRSIAMRTAVQRWGNSLALRIPRTYAAQRRGFLRARRWI